MYSQFTAMLVKTISKVDFLFAKGQFITQDSYSVALLLLTVSYFRVKKFLPLTLQLINTLEISIEKAFHERKNERNWTIQYGETTPVFCYHCPEHICSHIEQNCLIQNQFQYIVSLKIEIEDFEGIKCNTCIINTELDCGVNKWATIDLFF